MATEGESRYGNELLAWPGFSTAKQIGDALSENPELSDLLEQSQPGLTGRVRHLLDLIGFIKEIPPHTLPLMALTNAQNHLQSLHQQLQNVQSNPASAAQVETQVASALTALLPIWGIIKDADTNDVIQQVREEAKGAIHGLRTSSGRLQSDLDSIGADLKSEHERLKSSLQEEWGKTKESLVKEAASMRERTETSVTEARTNAEAHFQAMRTEVDAIRERADTAYQEALASFEQDKNKIEQGRTDLQNSFTEQVQSWSEAIVKAREAIESEIETGQKRLEEVVEWAESIRGDIQIAALAAGFDKARRRYRNRSWIALAVAVLLSAFTVWLTITFFSNLWDVAPDATNSELVRQVGLRLGAIALPLAAAVFAARVYRTNSHLEAVNSERAQAATSFEGFAQRASSDESKDAMLVILAQLVFAGRDTGHHTEENMLPLDVSALMKQLTSKR